VFLRFMAKTGHLNEFRNGEEIFEKIFSISLE